MSVYDFRRFLIYKWRLAQKVLSLLGFLASSYPPIAVSRLQIIVEVCASVIIFSLILHFHFQRSERSCAASDLEKTKFRFSRLIPLSWIPGAWLNKVSPWWNNCTVVKVHSYHRERTRLLSWAYASLIITMRWEVGHWSLYFRLNRERKGHCLCEGENLGANHLLLFNLITIFAFLWRFLWWRETTLNTI